MPVRPSARTLRLGLAGLAPLLLLVAANLFRAAYGQSNRPQPNYNTDPNGPYPMPPELVGVDLMSQSAGDVARKSHGCVHCHQHVHDPHFKDTVRLGCTDCHGGCADTTDKTQAHVPARYPEYWRSASNPVRSYTLLNHESPEF